MYESSVRSATATTGKSVLAIVAILSLLVSLFAVASPATATHEGAHLQTSQEGTRFDDAAQNANCPAEDLARIEPGQTLWHFVLTDPQSDEGTLTATFERADGTTFTVTQEDDDSSASVLHFYVITTDAVELVTASTDVAGGNLVLSHICNEVALTPTLTLDKVTVGGDAEFAFTLDGTPLADTLSGSDPAVLLAETADTYTITETVTEGWTLTEIQCSGNETPAVVEGTSITVTVGADEDVTCVFTNTLDEEENGELEVDKFNCTGEEDDTLFFVFGPFSIQSEQPDTEDCTIGAGVTFSVYTDAGEGVPGDFVLEATTDTEGIIEVDLPAGDYVLVEGAEGEEGPSQAFTIEAGSVTAIVVLNIEGEEENGEVKILKFLCPGEEDTVVFFEEGDESIPDLTECEVSDATFTIDDGEEFTTENGGAIRTVSADVEHTLAEVSPLTGSTTFTVAEGDRVTIIVINFEDEEETLGSVTINKEIACEVCETFTPGFFFNRGENNEGTAFTNESLPSNQVTIAGETFGDLAFGGETYESAVQEINAYLAADRSGDLDGEMGLSAQGQLVRQFLALYLNVAFADEGCDLANAIYTGSVELPAWVDADESGDVTVQELLDAAQSATDEAEMRAIAEAIDEVNNSGDGDAPVVLDCPEGTEGTSGAGFSFELYGPDDTELLADSGTTDETGTLVLDGDPDGSGLPLGEYLLVETTNEGGLECTITDVTVDGDGSAVLNEDGTVTITLTEEAADISITVVNECEQPGEEEEFGDIEIIKAAPDDPTESFSFSATWDGDGFVLMDGEMEPSGDLEAGTSVTVTEELTEAQIAAGWSLEGIDCGTADVDVDGNSVTITVVANTTITCTFTNELEEENEGELEIIKWFCPQVDEPQIFVFGPVGEEPIGEFGIQSHADDSTLPDQEGCTLGATADGQTVAEFTITGGPEGFEDLTVETSLDEILTLDLPVGDYTITETHTGLTADFSIEEGEDTAVVVFNYLAEEEGEGRLKIIKFFCDGTEDDVVFSIVEGGDLSIGDVDAPESATNCEVGNAAFTLNDGESDSDVFTLGNDGIRLIPLPEDEYTLSEVAPNVATSEAFDVTEGETTTVVVFNLAGEGGELPGETVTVSIMKHLCDDVATVEEFEAVENAGVAGIPGGEGTLSGLAATVLACPTIVLTGDVPTSGAVTNGNVDFDFTVIDASGTQVLSTDGMFEQAALCESTVDVDVNEDGDKADCLDTSHYMFEVIDGTVVITETEVPEGSTGLGTIRFTPDSEDETALATSIEVVEETGVIVLDTTDASATALEDGMIMIHAYNFAEAEGGNEGTQGGQGGPRSGTLGGQLPNTAVDPAPVPSMPAALVALAMLSGLGAAAYAVRAEVARRR